MAVRRDGIMFDKRRRENHSVPPDRENHRAPDRDPELDRHSPRDDHEHNREHDEQLDHDNPNRITSRDCEHDHAHEFDARDSSVVFMTNALAI